MYADPQYKQGVRKLLSPPLDLLLPPDSKVSLAKSLALADHPKADAAIKMINLIKATKQRALEDDPACGQPDGSLDTSKCPALVRVYRSVATKIEADSGLAHIFGQLAALGYYPNPVAVAKALRN